MFLLVLSHNWSPFACFIRVQSSSYTSIVNMSSWTLCFLKFHKQLNNFTAVAVLGFCHEPVGTMWLGDLTALFQNLD